MAGFRSVRPVRLILPRQFSSYPPRRPFPLGILNLATMAEVAMGGTIAQSASVDPPGVLGGRQPSPVSKARTSGPRRPTGCPLWVKSRHCRISARRPLYPRKQTLIECSCMSAKCQKQTHALQHFFIVIRSPGRRGQPAEAVCQGRVP